MTRRRMLRWAGAAVLLAAALVAFHYLPVKEEVPRFLEWVHGLGPAGGVVLGLAYAVGTILFLPGSLLTMAAGFLYGPLWGTVIASPASVLGATGAFLLGRTTARGWIRKRMETSARFKALQEGITRDGLKMLVLIRLSPIFPFNIVNYAFGLTKIRLRDFVLGSWIAMLPSTLLYVYLGSLVPRAAALGRHAQASGGNKGVERIFFWVGLVATAAVAWFATRIARRTLAKTAPELAEPDEEEADG